MEKSNKTTRDKESVGGSFIPILGEQWGRSTNNLTIRRLRALGSWSLSWRSE